MKAAPATLATLALLALAALPPAHAGDMTVTSPTLPAEGNMPLRHVMNGFGCDGENRSPALQWDHVPAGTRSFAVTLYDPDAPTGSGWWHWVAYNLPATLRGLPEGAGAPDGSGLPAGARQGRTDYGTPGYGGACPPPGAPAHRYIVTVHALKVETLPVPPDASAALVGYMLHMNRLDSAVLQTHYGR